MRNIDPPVAAEFRVLLTGYVGDRVAGTVSFVRDGDVRVIIDPGMVPEPAAILGPLGEVVDSPEEITDVIFSQHHPDYTLNAALFPRARFQAVSRDASLAEAHRRQSRRRRRGPGRAGQVAHGSPGIAACNPRPGAGVQRMR